VTTTQWTEQTLTVHLFSTSCTKPAVAAWYEGDVHGCLSVPRGKRRSCQRQCLVRSWSWSLCCAVRFFHLRCWWTAGRLVVVVDISLSFYAGVDIISKSINISPTFVNCYVISFSRPTSSVTSCALHYEYNLCAIRVYLSEVLNSDRACTGCISH